MKCDRGDFLKDFTGLEFDLPVVAETNYCIKIEKQCFQSISMELLRQNPR